MVKNSDDTTPLTQSPSITQETKARFNELLNAALSRDTSDEPQVFKTSSISVNPATQIKQSKFVPKAVPRKKRLIKNQEINLSEKHGNSDTIHSSEESSASRTVQRQVIAEVHSSRTRLLLSSSDDDILSEKKEKKKRKKSKWKQLTEAGQQLRTEGQENKSFELDENPEKNSLSRLSNRSYTVETPTFPVEDIKLLTAKAHESIVLKNNSTNNASPSRLSRRSYTIETPTIPDSSAGKDDMCLLKIKTPVPLPRRKSLKSIPDSDVNDFFKTTKEIEEVPKYVADHLSFENEQEDTVITIYETAPQAPEGDIEVSGSAAAELEESLDHTEDDRDILLAVRRQKRMKKRRKRSKPREQLELQEITPKSHTEVDSLAETSIHCTAKGKRKSDLEESVTQSNVEQIVGVTVHGVDCPLVDPLVRHPVMRLYVVDTSTGEYFSKSDNSRSVCYFEETTSYIPPIMTHPFDFKQQRSMQPQWEECLLLNERLSHLLSPHTLLLFELSDFLPATLAGTSTRYRKLGATAGWHVVAWAFLRPVAAGGTLNVGSRLRLQLYKPAKHPTALRTRTPAVFEWWGTAVRHKYSGCLHVTVSAVDPPKAPLSPQLRSRTALQSERGSEASVRSASASVAPSEVNSDDNHGQEGRATAEEVVWSRLPAQSCKVPNSRLRSVPVDGSMCLEFSGCGRWLACARQDVGVFNVPQFQRITTLSGHQGLVYCLRWSADSKILLSASADCTICVWRPSHRKSPLLQMLAHPSFVYCSQFVPTQGSRTVVSGCYDGLLRLWQGETHSSYQLTQELCGTASDSFVTAVCVTVDGARVVSADSQGSLRIYEVDEDGSLTGGRELRVREVRGKIISNVLAHPGGHRLLVQTRDSLVRSVDIATGAVIQTFKGSKNERVQTGVCVSPCGSLVFACGEDGSLTAWDGHTGTLRAVYCSLLPLGSAAIHYHPHEHMLAVASLSQPPVHIIVFLRNASGEEVGLNMVDSESTAAKIIKTMKESNKWQQAVPKVVASSSQNSILVQDRGVIKGRKKYKDVEKQDETSQTPPSTKWSSLPQLETYMDTSEDKDLRLLDIIRKMDSIILAAKQSGQP